MENNIPYQVKESVKVKAKICARCVMRVGSNHWISHWKSKHKIYNRIQMKEYKEFEEIPEPFFVSKPWKEKGHKQEEVGEYELTERNTLAMGKVLSEFM